MKFILVVAMFIISFAVFVSYTRPTYQQAKEYSAKVERVQEVLDKIQNIRELREKLRRRFAEFTEDKLERLTKLLPDHVDNIKLLLDIDGIAIKHGMRIQEIRLGKKETTQERTTPDQEQQDVAIIQTDPRNDLMSMSMQFAVESDYESIKNFIQDLESSLRIIEIERIRIEKTQQSSQKQLFADFITDQENQEYQEQSIIVKDDKPKYKASFTIRTYWLKKEEYEQ